MSVRGKAALHSSCEDLRKTPNVEVEIKLRVRDREAILRKLRRLKATGGTRVHEMNTLFDTANGELALEGKLVRIRVERPAPLSGAGKRNRNSRPVDAGTRPALLTYKGPAQDGKSAGSQRQRYKVREEHEVRMLDASALTRLLERIGLRGRFRYEKYRSTYRLGRLPGLIIQLDETPIGDFLELEGGREAIDRCATLLGFRVGDYIVKSYGALWLEARRSADRPSGAVSEVPGSMGKDMLFSHPDRQIVPPDGRGRLDPGRAS